MAQAVIDGGVLEPVVDVIKPSPLSSVMGVDELADGEVGGPGVAIPADDLLGITQADFSPSSVVHQSVEERPASTTHSSNGHSSKPSSDENSLATVRTLERIDGDMIPTQPILRKHEYAVALFAEGKVKSMYEEIIKRKKKPLMSYLRRNGSPNTAQISTKRTQERNLMLEMMSMLHDCVTHTDLSIGADAMPQASGDIQATTVHAEYASSKFQLLGFIINLLRDIEVTFTIFAQTGTLIELISSYLHAKRVSVRRYDKKMVQIDTQRDGLCVELFATLSDHTIPLPRRPLFVLAFDSTFEPTDKQVQSLNTQFDGSIPTIYPLVVNSSEHVERCVPVALPSSVRLKTVVRTTYEAAPGLGGIPVLDNDFNLSRSSSYLEVQQAIRRSPERTLARAADAIVHAALSDDFEDNWYLESMPDLNLRKMDAEPSRKAREASRTPQPRASRAQTPASRQLTPSSRKRVRDNEVGTHVKRLRLTPASDVTMQSTNHNGNAPDELLQANQKVADLEAELLMAREETRAAQEQASMADAKQRSWEEALSSLQRRYEKTRAETKEFNKKNRELLNTISRMQQQSEKDSATRDDLRQKARVFAEELKAARADLIAAGGSVAELEASRAEVRALTEQATKLEKSVQSKNSEFDFVAIQYQDARNKAAQATEESAELTKQVELLQIAADDQKRALRAMNYRASLEQYTAKAEQFRQEVRNRNVVIRKLHEENLMLKSKRGVQTRGSSAQPATSPGGRSRQNSPAPGHLGPHAGSRTSVLRHER